MDYFTIEHSRPGYWLDFVAYAVALLASFVVLACTVPHARWLLLLGLCLLGTMCWTLLEYLIHRFVLHGIKPFSDWHAAHHARPMALISAPTVLTAALFIALVFLPLLACGNAADAWAVTLGAVAGYLHYSVVHHATHHWRTRGVWFRERKRWHALHHHAAGGRHYGVTTSFWDRVFKTDKAKAPVS
jgi:sterol desaturase/sphingolipid hydroxylase (fatty acid hydroxylase superfamily)